LTQSRRSRKGKNLLTKPEHIPWKRITVEGIAVVVSILLAFGIDAWWSERQERQAELEYLIALQKDFLETRESLDNQENDVSRLFDNVDQVLSVIADIQTTELPESFSKMVGDAYFIPRPVPITGTYEDMVNSGSIQLIRNDDLRVALAEFMSILEIMKFHSNLNLQTYWDMHAPFANQNLIFSDFGWLIGDDATEEKIASYLVGPPIKHSFEINADAIKSQEFWNLMVGWKVLYADQLNQVLDAQNLCTEILHMLSNGIESGSR
jgi:hypothetical protein